MESECETVDQGLEMQLTIPPCQDVNDIAIWDNRCTFHCATFDFLGLGERSGNRAVGCGEVPYFDPNSKSRTEALRESGAEFGQWYVLLNCLEHLYWQC